MRLDAARFLAGVLFFVFFVFFVALLFFVFFFDNE